MKAKGRSRAGSAVEKAAAALRTESLSHGPGDFLGSEAELLARLQVSRPTFRQAVKMLAQEQLLTTRRGLHGGVYATRPDASAVAHVAAIYLATRAATQEHLMKAYPPSYWEAARIAARCTDSRLRSRLAEYHLSHPGEEELTVREFFMRDREFTRLMFEMTENPVLQLIAEIIYDFSLSFLREGVFSKRPERAREYVRLRKKLTEAILDGDEGVAAVYAMKCQEEVIRWMDADKVNTTQRLKIEQVEDGEAATTAAAGKRERPPLAS